MLPTVGGQKPELPDSRGELSASPVRRVPWHVWSVTRAMAEKEKVFESGGRIYVMDRMRHDPFPPLGSRRPSAGNRRLVLDVTNAVGDETVKSAVPYLRECRGQDNFIQQTSGFLSRVDLLGIGLGTASYVSFDAAGKLQSNKLLQESWNHDDMPEAVQTLVREALESMAVRVGWTDVAVPLRAFLLKYCLSAEAPLFAGALWHRDWNSLTMTVLLSPCRSDRSGFDGGGLSIGQRTENEGHYYSQGLTGLQTTIPDQTQTFDYNYRSGFIFDNLGSEHKVHDMHLYNPDENPDCTYERWLLSIFSDPEAKDVLALADELKDESLTRFLPGQSQS